MAPFIVLILGLAPSVAGLVCPQQPRWARPRAGRVVAMYRAPPPPAGFTWGLDEEQLAKVEALRKEGQLRVKARSERAKAYASWVAKAEAAAAAAAAKRMKDLQEEGRRLIKARADSQKACAAWVAKAEAAAAAAAAKRMNDLKAEGQRVIKARAETEKACAAWLAKAEKAEAAAAAEAAKLISA